MYKSPILDQFQHNLQMPSYSTMTYNSNVLNYQPNISFIPYTANVNYFNEYIPESNGRHMAIPVSNNKNIENHKTELIIPSSPSTIENSTPPTYSPANETFPTHLSNSPEHFPNSSQRYDVHYDNNQTNYSSMPYNPPFHQQYQVPINLSGTQNLQKYTNNIVTNSQYQYHTIPEKDKDEFKRRPYTKHNRMSIHANSVCCNCGTTKTTLWRRSESGEPECNPCNLYFRANRKPRPQHLMKKTILRRARRRPATKNFSDNPNMSSENILEQPLPSEFTEYFPSF
ncbi:GATA-binding factor C [Strongyloides ratti]|uniref:GATA-binding factor C n=1 Tax=Strongyloides ratti TaxID=34506 RepID=A0A090LDV2_STRRB|nr:GATA-binding factor C [Strongyloides ratti]CEF67942.1 GATA-binding factor C [Strongyloides ratti]